MRIHGEETKARRAAETCEPPKLAGNLTGGQPVIKTKSGGKIKSLFPDWKLGDPFI